MIPTQLDEVLVQSADTLGGAVRFKGTRIPVNILFDYVLLGEGLDEFLINYPDISKEAAQAVLSWERTQVASRFKLEIAV
jgi:uncharacterized protein (DUF433 family)